MLLNGESQATSQRVPRGGLWLPRTGEVTLSLVIFQHRAYLSVSVCASSAVRSDKDGTQVTSTISLRSRIRAPSEHPERGVGRHYRAPARDSRLRLRILANSAPLPCSSCLKYTNTSLQSAPVRSMLEDRLSPLLYVRRLVAFVTQTEVAMTGGDYHGCCRLLVGPLYRGPHSWP